METKQPIALLGTSHLHNAQQGSMAHMLNLRSERGVLKPITAKLPCQVLDDNNQLINMPVPAHEYVIQYVHRNAEFEHWLGVTAAGVVEWYDPASGLVTDALGTVPGIIHILGLKNFILFITATGVTKYLYSATLDEYNLIDIWEASFPVIRLSQKEQVLVGGNTGPVTAQETASTATDTSTAALIDAIYKLENRLSDEGKMIGMFWYRWAFRLYDGSHIFPSCPHLTSDFNVLHKQALYSYPITDVYEAMFYNFKVGHQNNIDYTTGQVFYSDLVFNYQPANFILADGLRDVIVGIDLFASKPVRPLKLDAESITYEMIRTLGATHLDEWLNLNTFAPVNTEVDNMDVDNWYLIQKYTISELVTGTTKDINLKGYWNNWQTRETLGKDSGSWHNMQGKTGFVYNSRLMLGDISTKLLEAYPMITVNLTDYNNTHMGSQVGDLVYRDYTPTTANLELKIITKLATDDGEVILVNDNMLQFASMLTRYQKTISGYTLAGGTLKNIVLPGTIFYPDLRAKQIELVVKDGNNVWRLIQTIQLTPGVMNNYSFFNSVNYTTCKEYKVANLTSYHRWLEVAVNVDGNNGITDKPVYTFPTVTNQIVRDQNRVIASGLVNPFTFEAGHSYRTGNGRVVALGSNARSINDGQFGEHPVLAYTTEGVFALAQGNFPVLFQSVSPVAGDVALSPHLLPLRNSVIFLGERGVTMLAGQDTVILSEILNGTAFNPLYGLNIYDQLTTLPALFNSQGVIFQETDIRKYIDSTTCLAYDHKRDELIVFTPAKLYSWFFSFVDKVWYKSSQNWRSVINSWPDSFVQDQHGQILDLSLESETEPAEILLQTNPIKMHDYFGVDDVLIDGYIQREGMGRHSGIYLFGAERDDNYFILGGTQTDKTIRNYKSNSFSRMKVTDIILLLTSNVDSQSFIIPKLTLTVKPKFNQIKS